MEINAFYGEDGPGGILSNLAHTPFSIDGHNAASFEGFLQAIKYDDLNMQAAILAMHGIDAKRAGKESNDTHNENRMVFWKGIYYPYRSVYHKRLLFRGLLKKFTQNSQASQALLSTVGHIIIHETGHAQDPRTSLPSDEFIKYLYEIRKILVSQQKDSAAS